MAILVFFTAVNSCNYPYIKAFQPYNHLLFLLGSSIFAGILVSFAFLEKETPPCDEASYRAGTLKIVGLFTWEKVEISRSKPFFLF